MAVIEEEAVVPYPGVSHCIRSVSQIYNHSPVSPLGVLSSTLLYDSCFRLLAPTDGSCMFAFKSTCSKQPRVPSHDRRTKNWQGKSI